MRRNQYTEWESIPLLLTINQVAILLQITPEHARKLCQSGKLPGTQFGGDWRVSRDAIRETINDKQRLVGSREAAGVTPQIR